MTALTRSPRWLADTRVAMNRLRALLRPLTNQRTDRPVASGVGYLRASRNRVSGRTRWQFSYAGPAPCWYPITVGQVGRLGLCRTRHEVEQLLRVGAS